MTADELDDWCEALRLKSIEEFQASACLDPIAFAVIMCDPRSGQVCDPPEMIVLTPVDVRAAENRSAFLTATRQLCEKGVALAVCMFDYYAHHDGTHALMCNYERRGRGEIWVARVDTVMIYNKSEEPPIGILPMVN